MGNTVPDHRPKPGVRHNIEEAAGGRILTYDGLNIFPEKLKHFFSSYRCGTLGAITPYIGIFRHCPKRLLASCQNNLCASNTRIAFDSSAVTLCLFSAGANHRTGCDDPWRADCCGDCWRSDVGQASCIPDHWPLTVILQGQLSLGHNLSDDPTSHHANLTCNCVSPR